MAHSMTHSKSSALLLPRKQTRGYKGTIEIAKSHESIYIYKQEIEQRQQVNSAN
jgi:hypothetical protein